MEGKRVKKTDSMKSMVSGFIAGIVITLALVAVFKGLDFSGGKGGQVAAELDGQVLLEKDLRQTVGASLIPIESDRYAVLAKGAEKWLEDQLAAKEAKAKGWSVPDLYFKEIWSRVKVSDSDVFNYYSKNSQLYNQSFDKVKDGLFKMLRENQYENIEAKYFEDLKAKYHAKIYLEKPKNYIEGAAWIPSAPQAAAGPVAGRPSAPSAGAPSVPQGPGFLGDTSGQPVVGPANAPVTLAEFSDFHCPFCSRVSSTISDLMKAYPGKIRRVWYHNPLAMHQGAEQTHQASECAAEQGKFWEYHDKLFSNVGGFKDTAAFMSAAKDLGLDQKKFQGCMDSGKYKDKVKANVAKGSSLGVRGTPYFLINGQPVSGAQPLENFKTAVENALHPERARVAPVAAPPSAPPAFVKFDDLNGRPSMGPENAPVTIVEFSDFHCPFCSRGASTMKELMKKYDGKLRLVWRHFPLPMHQGAERTHQAAECAAQQGKFWEYHDKLFEKAGSFKDDNALIKLADDLDLNDKKFKKCLESDESKVVVQKDKARGSQAGVNGTPAFFINGQSLSGAQPLEAFSQKVDAELAKKK